MSDLCRHFGPCGGCSLQDMAEDDYRALKRQGIVEMLARHGVEATVADTVSVPQRSRRRADFEAQKKGPHTLLGFHGRGTHDIVDMHECRLLTPALFAAVAPLRAMMAVLLNDGERAELHVTETETGLDLALGWKRKLTPALTAELAEWAARLNLARLTLNGQVAAFLTPPTVTFAKTHVVLPPRAFLQPTVNGERVLQHHVREILDKAKRIVDLFAGTGTFTFALAEKARVHAVERDAPALDALDHAARHTMGLKPVTSERRDLFKLPLTPPELKAYDGVCLDPPRAGASAQARQLAASGIKRIAYVSCNPESFARDARILCDAGYTLGAITPVDQFLWSSHIELVAGFTRR